jgi:PAS domain S-box-containing protein
MLALGLFRFQLLDIVPVARDTVIKGMSDGLRVLDVQNRIVDINPAIEGITGLRTSEIVGRSVAQILSCWTELTEGHREAMETQSEVAFDKGREKHYYDLRISPL